MSDSSENKKTLLAGGCFWCIEAAVRNIPGVVEVFSGYADRNDMPERREVVEIEYDPHQISFADLIRAGFKLFDPTDAGGQFHDRGYGYTTAVYYQDEEEKKILEAIVLSLNNSGTYDSPIVTSIEAMPPFDPAPEYHQKYKEKNPDHYKGYYRASGREAYVEGMKEK